MDQMLCKEFKFCSGAYFAQQSRNRLVVFVEGLTRNVITYCMIFFHFGTVIQEELSFKIFLIYSSGGHFSWQSGII